MRIYIRDQNDAVLDVLDDTYYDLSIEDFLKGKATVLSFSMVKDEMSYKLITTGKNLSFVYDNEEYWLTCMIVEQDEYYLSVTAWSIGLEYNNETIGPYKSPKAMTFVEYLNLIDFEKVLTIGINEVSDKKISYEWTGTDKKLARLYSLANVFDAEIAFVTRLNDDGSLKQIVINVYHEHDDDYQGVGNDRRNETFYFGEEIKTIKKTEDKTGLYTAITATGKDGLTIATIDREVKDENGLVLYKTVSKATADYPDVNKIYAVQARLQFPSTVKSNDRWTVNDAGETEYSSAEALYGYMLSKLKESSIPKVTWEIEGNIKAKIGDTVRIADDGYKPTLYLEARVTGKVRKPDNLAEETTTFSNVKELQSQVDQSLLDRVNALIEQTKPYTLSLMSDNGVTFKNSEGSTTLSAIVYNGTQVITPDVTVRWYKDDVWVKTGYSLTIEAKNINAKAVYKAIVIDTNGKERATQDVTVFNVDDGRGIKGKPVLSYASSGSINTVPTTWQATIPSVPAGSYLWTREVTTYSDDTTSEVITPVLQGPKGNPGNDGVAGKDGIGIKSTQIMYAGSDSGTVKPTAGWTSDVPVLAAGKYLWTETTWLYSDNTGESGYSVSRIGKDGNTGADGIAGKDGVGLRSTAITYGRSTSGTSNTGITWTSTVPNVPAGEFLWTKTTWSYTDNTSETGYSVAKMGNTGATGPKGDQGVQGFQGLQGPTGTQGVPGPKGADGKTQYTHIAYANSADGVTNFSTSDSNRAYIGMYVDFNIDDSTTPSDYSWTLIKGADGTQGTPGTPGADGKTPYFHTAWSYSADGTDGFTTIYPNLNLEQHTGMLVDESNNLLWGIKGSATATMTYEAVTIPNNSKIVNGVRVTQTTSGQAGWRSPLYSVSPYTEVGTNTQVSKSAYIKNNSSTDVGITLQIGYSENADGSSAGYANTVLTIPASSDFTLYKDTLNLPSTAKYIWFYVYTQNTTTTADFTFAGYKAEWGGVNTPWMLSSSEVTTADWPSYIGQYTDFTQADSTNPSKYTWSLIRGNDGKDGKSITDSKQEWASSTSGTTAPTVWQATIPTVTAGQYLWSRITETWSDNNKTYEFTIGKIGENGQNAQMMFLSADKNTMMFNADNTAKFAQTATITAKYQNVSGTGAFTAKGIKADGTSETLTLAGTGDSRTITSAMFKSDWVMITVTATLAGLTDTLSIIKVNDGAQGIGGAKGYFHSAWAMSADGRTGFSTTVSEGKWYIGTYFDFVEADSTDPARYNWLELAGAVNMYIAYAWSQDGKDRFTRNKPIVNMLGNIGEYNNLTDKTRWVWSDSSISAVTSSSYDSNTKMTTLNIVGVSGYEIYSIPLDFTALKSGYLVIDFIFSRDLNSFVNSAKQYVPIVLSSSPLFGYEETGNFATYQMSNIKAGKRTVVIPYTNIDETAYLSINLGYLADGSANAYQVKIGNIMAVTDASLAGSGFSPSFINDYDNAVPRYIGRSLKDSNNQADYKWEPNPERKPWTSYAQGVNGEGLSLMPYGEQLLLDTDVPSLTKVSADYNRYFSESGNVAITSIGFKKVDGLTNSGYVVEATSNGTGGTARDLVFYQSGNTDNSVGYLLTVGKTYTLSCMARKISGYAPKIRFQYGSGNGEGYKIQYVTVDSTDKKQYSWTFVFSGTASSRFYVGGIAGDTAGTVQTWDFKLELANTMGIPTPWTPASSEDPLGAIPKYVGTAALPYEDPYKYECKLNPDWLQQESNNNLANKVDNDTYNNDQSTMWEEISNRVTEEEAQAIQESLDKITGAYTDFVSTGGKHDQDLANLKSAINTDIQKLADKVLGFDFVNTWFRIGDGGLSIGEANSNFEILISNDQITFYDSGTAVAYVSNQSFFINSGMIVDDLQIGKFKFAKVNDNLMGLFHIA